MNNCVSFSVTCMEVLRYNVGNIYSSKSDGTQVSLLFGIQDGGKDSKWQPPMCSYRVDYSSF